jgi:glyoxylase-like metal-dependent hydrolase (beta-lactamase superfamily II)
VIDFIKANGLTLEWLIETHVHADHLSGAPYIQGKLGGKIGIGENITVVQDTFGKVFNEGTEFQRDGSQFDRLFKDGDEYQIGGMTVFAMHTPGHTPACMTHVVGDAAFVGDTLFMPDGGSARADFPGGDARTLYRSIKRVLSMPDATRLFMCHDYGPNGREIRWETSVAEQNAHNIHVKDGISEDQFVQVREARDATLAMPKLIIPSLQVNMRGGDLPANLSVLQGSDQPACRCGALAFCGFAAVCGFLGGVCLGVALPGQSPWRCRSLAALHCCLELVCGGAISGAGAAEPAGLAVGQGRLA